MRLIIPASQSLAVGWSRATQTDLSRSFRSAQGPRFAQSVDGRLDNRDLVHRTFRVVRNPLTALLAGFEMAGS
jgi:hypothetical protein